jgi:hypothetical protein
MSPAEADECELWQLAVLLGEDRADEDDTGVQSLEARVAAEQENLKARMAAAGRGVRSETPPSDREKAGPVDVTADIMRQMGISTK